jgi:hypothetical protein
LKFIAHILEAQSLIYRNSLSLKAHYNLQDTPAAEQSEQLHAAKGHKTQDKSATIETLRESVNQIFYPLNKV